MQALQSWSFAKVLLVSGAWILLCVLLAAAYVLFQFRGASAASAASTGIGAVSVGFSFNALLLTIPLLPPIVLIVAYVRRRRFA
jgi:hypothetical protein